MVQLVKNHLQCGRPMFDPWVGKIPWRRERLPTLVFWPGEFHGLYRPWGHEESDTTERLSLSFTSQLTDPSKIWSLHPQASVLSVVLQNILSCHWSYHLNKHKDTTYTHTKKDIVCFNFCKTHSSIMYVDASLKQNTFPLIATHVILSSKN